jgi:8-oxo-dGTP pyrophosphatase MutT (NUDIX family)
MKIPKMVGTLVFWLTWPALWIYLKDTQRSRVIVVHDGKILLIKGWLGTNAWALPGGGRKGNETAVEAAEREVREETGIDIEACEKQILFTDRRVNECGFSFNCDCLLVVLADTPVLKLQRAEIFDAVWKKPEEMTELALSPVANQCLAAWFESSNLVH